MHGGSWIGSCLAATLPAGGGLEVSSLASTDASEPRLRSGKSNAGRPVLLGQLGRDGHGLDGQ